MGSYLEHVTQDDPERKARLMKELAGFLERDRDPVYPPARRFLMATQVEVLSS